MWRVKTLNLGLTPSPQPGKTAMRTPLRELKLQPGLLPDSGKGPPRCSTLTPSLCKLRIQEGNSNSSQVDFFNAKDTNFPSPCLETSQHESDAQFLDPAPQTNFTLKTPEKAADPVNYSVDPMDDCIVKTMVLTPFPAVQQRDMALEGLSDTVAHKENCSPNEPSRTGDLVRNEAASCVDDSILDAVAAAMPEKLTFPHSPSCLLEYSPKLCSEQPLHCSKESLKDSRTETIPEDIVPPGNNVLQSSTLWLSPSTVSLVGFPVHHVDPEEEVLEHRIDQETEMSFSKLPEETELKDQTFISNTEDVLPICPAPNPAEMESQADQGSALEDTSRILGTDSETWMSPLTWLEKGVNTSAMLENLRQSLSLPSMLQDATLHNTPLSTCSVGTWLTPPAPQEESTNKSQTEGAKDGPLKREHRPWGHCSPDLTALSRHDLEDNLLSSLVILEVLSRQLQTWKSQLTAPHAETKDSSTQTDNSLIGGTKKPQHESQETRQALQQARNIMQSWMLVSKELIPLLHQSLVHLEEDRVTVCQESQCVETLVSYCSDVLKKLRAKLQSLKTEREEARHREEVALKGKDGAETVLEVFRAHASQRISQLEQDLTSMREFRGLLQEAQTRLIGLHAEQEDLAQQMDSLTSTLHQDWTSMQVDYGTWTALLSRSRQLSEKLTAKSQQALQERDAAVEEKQQVSKELEQVSAHLEDCKGQIEQLNLQNSHLATDLRAQLQILASTDSQLKELQSQHAHCAQDLATKDELLCQLTQSKEEQAAQWQKEEMALKHMMAELQHQQVVLAKEVQDLKESLEFADQESQVAHLELGQIECQLSSTLHALRERSLQCENLKDMVENLKAELASTEAKHQEKTLEKTQQYSQELRLLTEQLQSLTHFLQTKVEEKAEPETACTPAQEHPLPSDSALSGNLSTTTADEEPESAPVSLLGSGKSAFTRVTPMVSLQSPETPSLERSLAEMSTVFLRLQSLCSLLQESKEEAIGALQRKLCDLQARLEAQKEQHEEAQKSKDTDIEKLNQALCLRYKNEKELQEVIQKQNKKILEQIDKSSELISLREEVAQLTRSLQRAETEKKVLREALEGQIDPTCQLMAANWIQEKVCLSQEVDKLRVMFLEMKNEKTQLMVKYQSHRNILEENLRRSDTELKKLDDTVQHIYETLLSIPDVVRSCKELKGLLEFLS